MQLFFLLLLISFLPLANITYYYFSYEFGKYLVFLFISALLLLFQGINMFHKKLKVKIPITLVLFFLAYVVSTIFSINPLVSFFGYYGSFTGGLLYIFLLVMLFWTSSVLKKEKDLILRTIFFSGISVSVVGIWQYFNHVSRIYSTIGQPNRLAFFLLAIIPIGLFLFLNEKRKYHKLFYFIGELFIFMAFFLTFSRSSYVVLLVLLILIYINNLCHREPSQTWRGDLFNLEDCFASPLDTLGTSLAMTKKIFFIFIITGFLVFGLIFSKSVPSTISNFQKSSLSLRLAEWQGSWEAVKHRNIFRQLIGFGPETVYYTFFKYRPIIYNSSLEESGVGPNQIRNYYLHLLSGIGIFGLISYLFWVIKINYSAYKKNKGIFYSLLGISFMSLFYYQTDTVLVLFWILSGLVYE